MTTSERSCEHEGCTRPEVIECRLSYVDVGPAGTHPGEFQDEIHFYCSDHCEEEGFCSACGSFCAGLESFDFAEALGGIQGLCEDCSDELKNEIDEGQEP